MRNRKAYPDLIQGCGNCEYLQTCGGGCAARVYLHLLQGGRETPTIYRKDPYCPRDNGMDLMVFTKRTPFISENHHLVHQGYLCTGILHPIGA